MHAIPQPSKEQVRAYMMQRCRTQLPPPAPDEIRRQLGWCWQCDNGRPCLVFPSPQFTFVLPGNLAQLSALLTMEWLFLAAGYSVAH
ncbi:hypothetical protein ASD15_04985 [Massilia sp. Root351]|uniref:hypothetical protein n=1 Tax=Massilia sp. Root351 TaxID=1736522 RepID=UPI000708AAB6|nr:hypothetical protein [Massilia sp. Root351]KQV91382.1 hypothetical protein ASD15_04985 [Massilia sp. Root351]